MPKKVHARGIPCNVNRRRWSSMLLSSTGNAAKVTCLRCQEKMKPATDGHDPGA